jgi:hypothetical protein
MTGIIGIVLSLFSNGGSIILGIGSALGGLLVLLAFVKKTGVKEAEAAARIRALENSYDAEKTRRKIDEDVNTLTDDELDQLRRQYERPEPGVESDVGGAVRGVESYPHKPL